MFDYFCKFCEIEINNFCSNPYKPNVLFTGQRQTVLTKIRHRVMWYLMRIFAVYSQEILLKFRNKLEMGSSYCSCQAGPFCLRVNP